MKSPHGTPWIAAAILLITSQAGGCRRDSNEPLPNRQPTTTSLTDDRSIKVLQKGLGPRRVLTIPDTADSYDFRFQITTTRKHHRSRVLVQGTLARDAGARGQGRDRPLVVTKLDRVRPASLSRLLLKTVVGRPLSSLLRDRHGTAGLVPSGPLPSTPLGPGAHWKVTGTIGPKDRAFRVLVAADFRMEQAQGKTILKETSVLTCPRSAKVICHGTMQAEWRMEDGRTKAVLAKTRLVIGEGPGKMTETQIFEARALTQQTIP